MCISTDDAICPSRDAMRKNRANKMMPTIFWYTYEFEPQKAKTPNNASGECFILTTHSPITTQKLFRVAKKTPKRTERDFHIFLTSSKTYKDFKKYRQVNDKDNHFTVN